MHGVFGRDAVRRLASQKEKPHVCAHMHVCMLVRVRASDSDVLVCNVSWVAFLFACNCVPLRTQGNYEPRANHEVESGWYSEAVMAYPAVVGSRVVC